MEDLFQPDLDETYDNIRLNFPDMREKINHAFHHCSPYLDENYKNEFSRKDKFFERLWELWVCCRILESPFKENLLPNKDKKKGNDGPDFIIKNVLNDKHLVLECVCPNYKEENIVDTGKFRITTEPRENGVSASWPDESYEEFILSRYMNSLATKAEQLEKHKKNKLYADSYYILCVSGMRLSWLKGKKHLNHRSLPTEGEFKKALKGLEWEWVSPHTSTICIKSDPISVQKINEKNTVLSTSDDKYMESIGKFSGFVFTDCDLLFTHTKIKPQIYEAFPELKEILAKIFNS